MLSSTGQGRGIPVSEAALQVGSPKLSLENVAYVLEHHKTTTVSTMSRALHMRWETLKHRMDEMGLTAFSTRQMWSKADLAKFRKLAKEGKTLPAMVPAGPDNPMGKNAGRPGRGVWAVNRLHQADGAKVQHRHIPAWPDVDKAGQGIPAAQLGLYRTEYDLQEAAQGARCHCPAGGPDEARTSVLQVRGYSFG